MHTALYRKYRPDTWKDVIGQDHIIEVLKDEAKKPAPHHAYLFAGTRGTGKTTVARIFAKEIGTAPQDIYEIDAASNTSVEDIRTLTEAVHTLPFSSKYKVYILDEVHMLSKSAFNAFLKTLEEPPRHVIFILATTELHKIPDTIISRCLTFHFKKPSIETLAKVVIDIAKREGKKIEADVSAMIASAGNGSFRDTLSTLQSLMGSADTSDIESSHVQSILQMPSPVLVADFITAFLAKDIKGSFSVLEQVRTTDVSVRVFVEQVIEGLREKMITSSRTSVSSGLVVANALQICLDACGYIGKTHIPTLPLEIMVLKFAQA